MFTAHYRLEVENSRNPRCLNMCLCATEIESCHFDAKRNIRVARVDLSTNSIGKFKMKF